MPANHPYDPRYNAKIYVPKLSEEQRRARATPLENLRGLRFRTETPAAPSPAEELVPPLVTTQIAPAAPSPTEALVTAPVPTQVAPADPSPTEAAVPAPTPAQEAHTTDYIPTAREVLFAEFPELIPFPYQDANGEEHLEEKSDIGEPCLVVGPGWEAPHKSKIDVRCSAAFKHNLISSITESVDGPGGTVLHARARDPQRCFSPGRNPTPEPGTPQRAGPSPDFKNAGRSRTPGGPRRAGFARPIRDQAPWRRVPLRSGRSRYAASASPRRYAFYLGQECPGSSV